MNGSFVTTDSIVSQQTFIKTMQRKPDQTDPRQLIPQQGTGLDFSDEWICYTYELEESEPDESEEYVADDNEDDL